MLVTISKFDLEDKLRELLEKADIEEVITMKNFVIEFEGKYYPIGLSVGKKCQKPNTYYILADD